MKIPISKSLYTTTKWNVISNNYDQKQAITEGSNFMIGNGYLGYRGTFCEDRKNEYQGCIVTDTWDNADGKWEELATVHNGLYTALEINNQSINMTSNVLHYRRELDMKTATTSRVIHQEIDAMTIKLKEEKFASLSNKNVIGLKLEIESDSDCSLNITTGIDLDIWSINGHHFSQEETFEYRHDLGTKSITNTYKDQVVVLEKNFFEIDSKSIENNVLVTKNFSVKLEKGKPFTYTKFMIVSHSNDQDKPEDYAKQIYDALENYEVEKKKHINAWEEVWNNIDILIDGDDVSQVGIRFNLYHAWIATPMHKPLPIGARGLSCQAYQGAAFWDQEVFNLPMFLYTQPAIARQLLIYRYKTLPGAIQKAQKHHYEGAFYAWISGKTGKELCPDFFFKDVVTNRNIRNHFNLWQIHISPDIATTIDKYVEVTNDIEFRNCYGAEMVFQIARFLASRVDYKPRRDRYEIIRVQGPDEYHENVDNNAFTNYQAKKAFEIAIHYLDTIDQKELNRIFKKIDLSKDELMLWKDINNKLYIPTINEDGLLEQFEGYFELESIVPAKEVTKRLLNEEEYYGWPNGIAVFTQCIKQADVIQLMHLYPDLFPKDIIKKNYEYYEPRTLHFSSLSPSVYSTVAARVGLIEDAYRLFKKSMMIDLLNTNEAISGGTFIGGMHTAANASVWQMAVLGFAGFHYDNHHFSLSPNLPKEWNQVSFQLVLGGSTIRFTIGQHQITICPEQLIEPLKITVQSALYELKDKKIVVKY